MERLFRKVYDIWKKDNFLEKQGVHPSEEVFALFIDKKLSLHDKKSFMEHVIFCRECKSKLIAIAKALPNKAKFSENLLSQIKKTINESLGELVDISLRFKKGIFEVINSNLEYVLGNKQSDFIVLRNKDKQLKDYIIFYKKISSINIKVRIEHKKDQFFSALIEFTNVKSKKISDDLRVGLFLNSKELESYVVKDGKAYFDNLEIKQYRIKIMKLNQEFGSIGLSFHN